MLKALGPSLSITRRKGRAKGTNGGREGGQERGGEQKSPEREIEREECVIFSKALKRVLL
jgi:hypothetical protein